MGHLKLFSIGILVGLLCRLLTLGNLAPTMEGLVGIIGLCIGYELPKWFKWFIRS